MKSQPTQLESAFTAALTATLRLRAAYTVAIDGPDRFAEIVLLSLIERAAKLEQDIARACQAAKGTT